MPKVLLVTCSLILGYYSSISQNIQNAHSFCLINKTNKNLNLYCIDQRLIGKPIYIAANSAIQAGISSTSYLITTNKEQNYTKASFGDTIAISFDDNQILLWASKNKAISTYYNALFTTTGSLKTNRLTPSTNKQLTILQRDSIAEAMYLQRIKIIDSISNMIDNNPVSKAEIINEINSAKIIEKLLANSVFSNADVLKHYQDSLKKYITYINASTSPDFTLQFLFASNDLLHLLCNTSNPDSLSNTATTYFSGRIKDFLLFKTLSRELTKDNFKMTDKVTQYASKTISAIQDSFYKAEAMKILQEQTTANKGWKNIKAKTFLQTNTGARKAFEEVLRQYTGKLIYIDFWASWCMPCREEMVYSEKLQNYFKNKKIVFVYLSLDKSPAEWVDACTSYSQLMKENTYLIEGDFRSELAIKYMIKTIPHYMLFGKDGKLISADVSRPRDESTFAFIEHNL